MLFRSQARWIEAAWQLMRIVAETDTATLMDLTRVPGREAAPWLARRTAQHSEAEALVTPRAAALKLVEGSSAGLPAAARAMSSPRTLGARSV